MTTASDSMIRTEARKVEEYRSEEGWLEVGLNEAAAERGGKRRKRKRRKEHQNVKNQHRREELSIRFNDQNRG